MQFAIDIKTRVRVEASRAIQGQQYQCCICGHDAFRRAGAHNEPHFAHHKGAPEGCPEREAAPSSYRLDVNGDTWTTFLQNVPSAPNGAMLFVFEENGRFGSLQGGEPVDQGRTHVYLAPMGSSTPPQIPGDVRRLAEQTGYVAWQIHIARSANLNLQRWFASIGHPIVVREILSNDVRLLRIIASAINADPELGVYGTADLGDRHYELQIPGGERNTITLRRRFEAVTDATIDTYCRAQGIPKRCVNFRHYSNNRIGALTLKCTI
ncbi:MAG: hypothetical protein HUU21_28495 [Polyangiaceae bacterium]|nr:hypothetical protein [Polyangiaceae bacterium]